MAFLFCDSFDHYATADVLSKWLTNSGGTTTIQAAAGRRASGSMRVASSTTQSMPFAVTGSTAITGFALKLTTLGTSRILSVLTAGTAQVSLALNGSGFLQAWRGNLTTLLGTASIGAIGTGAFYYIELKTVLHASAGTCVVHVNGVEVLNLTAQNTAPAGTAWDSILLAAASPGNSQDHDDLYVLDGSGSAPLNDFLGDVRVDARYPTGAGSTTGWTPSTGANWSAVDDAAPNGDTDYVSATTAPLTDTYATQDAPVPGATLYAVQLCLNAKKSDAGTCTLAPVVRHAGTDYPGTSFNPGTGYAYGVIPYGTNPGTGLAWTEAGFNAAEFGVKRTA